MCVCIYMYNCHFAIQQKLNTTLYINYTSIKFFLKHLNNISSQNWLSRFGLGFAVFSWTAWEQRKPEPSYLSCSAGHTHHIHYNFTAPKTHHPRWLQKLNVVFRDSLTEELLHILWIHTCLRLKGNLHFLT